MRNVKSNHKTLLFTFCLFKQRRRRRKRKEKEEEEETDQKNKSPNLVRLGDLVSQVKLFFTRVRRKGSFFYQLESLPLLNSFKKCGIFHKA